MVFGLLGLNGVVAVRFVAQEVPLVLVLLRLSQLSEVIL
jgi:hypothetical protein